MGPDSLVVSPRDRDVSRTGLLKMTGRVSGWMNGVVRTTSANAGHFGSAFLDVAEELGFSKLALLIWVCPLEAMTGAKFCAFLSGDLQRREDRNESMDVGRVCVGLHPSVLSVDTANATRKWESLPHAPGPPSPTRTFSATQTESPPYRRESATRRQSGRTVAASGPPDHSRTEASLLEKCILPEGIAGEDG